MNRDFVKLEAPETRAFVKVLNDWDPDLFIDLHTTNGSHHRYTITYQGPKNPGGDPAVLEFCRDKLMPGAGKLLKTRTGFESFFYGNFEKDHTVWSTYGATPRFGTTYVGLRGRMSVLSESYSYADYKTRVIASREFARAVLEYAAASEPKLLLSTLRGVAARAATLAELKGRPKTVAIRSEARASKDKVTVFGYVEEKKEGRTVATTEPKDYLCSFEQDFVPTLTVPRPHAYLVPAKHEKVIANLKLHGAKVETLDKAVTMDVEVEVIDAIDRAPRAFEKHKTIDLKTTPKKVRREVPAGTAVVRTAGPIANLLVYLLEARSDDGLATWNFFDEGLEVGGEFPVLKVRAAADLPN